MTFRAAKITFGRYANNDEKVKRRDRVKEA